MRTVSDDMDNRIGRGDVLNGSKRSDRASGGTGNDRCLAEKRTSCGR